MHKHHMLNFYAVNATHYYDILIQEANGRKRPEAMAFRYKMWQYYENHYCLLQGPGPLIQLGFIHFSLANNFLYPLHKN